MMKRNILLIISMFCLFSCMSKKEVATEEVAEVGEMQWKTYAFSDSSKFCKVTMEVSLPMGDGNVEKLIRDSLMAIVAFNASHFQQTEDNHATIAPFKAKEVDDFNAFVTYYGKSLMEQISKENSAMLKEQLEYMREDSTFTPEQVAECEKDYPQWEYDMKLKHVTKDSLYITVSDDEYGYWGGAHGGVIGRGTMVFRADNGEMLRDIVRKDMVRQMQPLLKKGLKQYFTESGEKVRSDAELMQMLMLSEDAGGMIPLPSRYEPYPTAEGIVFTYGQYEIACYAAGMPCFTVSYDDIKPYLSPSFSKLMSSSEAVAE